MYVGRATDLHNQYARTYVRVCTYVRTYTPYFEQRTCTDWQLQGEVNTLVRMAVQYANPHTATVHPEYSTQQVTGIHQSTVGPICKAYIPIE